MNARKNKSQGFTLVEILIVVVILGILAAIVIPQFTSASESAKASSLVSQLQTIRSQLELYQVQHNGDYPDLSTDWDQMTKKTNAAGETGEDDSTKGPYLQKAPANPFNNSSGTGGLAADGWNYNATSGVILAVLSDEDAAELGLSADDVVAAGEEPVDP